MNLKEQIAWCKLQIKAGYEVVAIGSILTRLKGLEKHQSPPHPFHNHAVAAYLEFLEKYKLPKIFDPLQGKPLKEILYQLQGISKDQTPESAYSSFVYILRNWDKTNAFLHKQKSIASMKKYLLEIIDNIKNGTKNNGNIRTNSTTAHTADGRKGFGKL